MNTPKEQIYDTLVNYIKQISSYSSRGDLPAHNKHGFIGYVKDEDCLYVIVPRRLGGRGDWEPLSFLKEHHE